MTDKKTFELLNFISKNENFSLKNGYEIAEEKFGWQIFLKAITELENLNLIKENEDLSFTLTKIGLTKLSELENEFETAEKDKKAERKKLHNESKLSDWQVKTFWPLFVFGIFGGLYSGYDIIKNLTKEENVQEKAITKEEMESELSKLRTLILTQKKEIPLIHSSSEKGK